MQELFGGLCVVTMIGCQIWLILLIMRGSPMLALIALVVPFFTWYFAIQNWDIAKLPFLGHITALVVLLGFAFMGPT